MIPSQITFIPLFIIMTNMHLTNSLNAFMLLQLFNAFAIFMMRQKMMTINDAYIEAAVIDGASMWRIFFKIILPQVIKRILPSVTNEVITLVKDTSLAFTLSVAEMFSIAKALAASQTNMIPFVAAGLFYYIFNLVVAVGMEWVEKRMDYYR